MNEAAGAAGPHTVWINWTDHVISFTPVEDGAFEPRVFSSGQEKMDYVFSHCSAGFRIQ